MYDVTIGFTIKAKDQCAVIYNFILLCTGLCEGSDRESTSLK